MLLGIVNDKRKHEPLAYIYDGQGIVERDVFPCQVGADVDVGCVAGLGALLIAGTELDFTLNTAQ